MNRCVRALPLQLFQRFYTSQALIGPCWERRNGGLKQTTENSSSTRIVKDLTYNNVILEKLEKDNRIIENAIESLEEDYAHVAAKLKKVRSSPKSLARAEEKKLVDEEL